MNRLSISVFVFSCALMVGCPPTAGEGSTKPPTGSTSVGRSTRSGDPVVVGNELYLQTCVACHGAGAKGVPNLGSDLTTSLFFTCKSNDELVGFLKVGRAADHPDNTTRIPMPPRGGNPALSDDDLRSIVLYLRSLRAPQ